MSDTSIYKGYESLKYTVEEKKNNIEIRRYAPALIAEVEVLGERDLAINAGFRILAGYIFGNNISKVKIPMTTPVAQIQKNEKIAMTTPVAQIGAGDKWIVQFMMPSQYTLDTLPKAKDEQIQFKMTKAVKMVVIRFPGLISQMNLAKHLEVLEGFIFKESMKVQRPYQYMFYDAPWTLPFMRRNEIAFIITS